MGERNSKTKQSASKAPMRLVLMAGLVIAAAAGCGDDDDTSAQEKYCEAGASLEASVEALLDLDLVAEGTDGLESALAAVGSNVNELDETAADAAADDVDELRQSVEGLEGAVSDLGGEISSENVAGVESAVQSVGAAAQAVVATLSDC
jgi:ABC-type transporter Mla subunit MlaD